MIDIGPSPFIPGFRLADIDTGEGVTLRVARGGSGPPLLLLHGHPQTHVTWHRVAPVLAEHFSIIAPDLRGYGDSAKPPDGAGHITYSKRAMAGDMARLMQHLGHAHYGVAGHDRGGRVAHRLALDAPATVTKLCVIDIAPTATMYARTNKAFATRYFWWFFLIQPEPLPETLIGANPEYFLRHHINGQSKTPGSTPPHIFAEYLRCYSDPATRHAICEDYRAAASIDLEHDAADSNKRIAAPVRAIWGAKGVVGQMYDVLETWSEKALQVEGRAFDCGHTLQEERAEETAADLLAFFRRAADELSG